MFHVLIAQVAFLDHSRTLIGIAIALLGAVFLSLGAQYQSRGVGKIDAAVASALLINGGDAVPTIAGSPGRVVVAFRAGVARVAALLRRPSWLVGTSFLAVAVCLQLLSLTFAPLIVVQPIGVVALVVTALLNANIARVRLNAGTVQAIALCVGGVLLFVTVAALSATEAEVTRGHLFVILASFLALLLGFGATLWLNKRRVPATLYIIAAGSVYGFVATLAKAVIGRIQQAEFDVLTFLCLLGLLLGTLVGMFFVNAAYSSGPPDLVVAGLTVVDPLVAIVIGLVVLGEAQGAPAWVFAVFVIAGLVATLGVFRLAKHHPQVA